MNIVGFKFLDSVFLGKTLVIDKQHKKLEELRDGDEFWRNPEKMYMKLDAAYCVTAEDIVSHLSQNYETGEEGDRQIKQDTIHTFYEWDDHLSKTMPVMVACGTFILYLGLASQYIDVYLTLPTDLQNSCKFLPIDSDILSKTNDFHSKEIDEYLFNQYFDNIFDE